jgi:hypothetical protein
MLTFVRAEPFTITATAKETGEEVGEWKVRALLAAQARRLIPTCSSTLGALLSPCMGPVDTTAISMRSAQWLLAVLALSFACAAPQPCLFPSPTRTQVGPFQVPAGGDKAKLKVKVRYNLHGLVSVENVHVSGSAVEGLTGACSVGKLCCQVCIPHAFMPGQQEPNLQVTIYTTELAAIMVLAI